MSRHYSLVGTEEYIAPETIDDTDVSYASDLWSLGVITFQMLEGKTPFIGKTAIETFQNISNLKGIEYKTTADEFAKDFIINLLRTNPEERIGAKDIMEIKYHPFFKEINWENVRFINPPFIPKDKKLRPQRPPQLNLSFSDTN